MADVTIRPYQPGDEAGIVRSFNVVFREVCGPGYQDRTMDAWRWEFLENPHGWRMWVAVDRDGTIAANYAGVPYCMTTPHGPVTFVHCVDSFVHPAYRQGLKKTGLFLETAYPFFADCKARGDAVLYGYPVQAARRIGERYLGYTTVRVVNYLCLDLGEPGPRAPERVQVERVAAFGAAADQAWRLASADRLCATVRDGRYLDWRFARCPGQPYELHVARRDGSVSGVMVLRPEHELVPGACTIADWVVPPRDAETTDALLACAAARGRERGRKTLMTVFPDPAPEHAALRSRGFQVVPSARYLERFLMRVAYHPAIQPEWLAEHWWYTLGDSDLV